MAVVRIGRLASSVCSLFQGVRIGKRATCRQGTCATCHQEWVPTIELFQNCIKLAIENKINQKNTWELKLIDHLSEIIRVDAEEDTETNFQKASCTLEAGVKIYSLRVDSVHSEAYKILGGINRAGLVNEQETLVEGDNNNNNRDDGDHSKKEPDRKTLAQFDGVKGLLLNNLAVYGGCRVLFDSLEVLGKFILCSSENNSSDMVAISFAKGQKSEGSTRSVDENDVEFNGNLFGNYEAWTFNHDNGAAVTDDGFTFGDPTIHSHYEGNDSYTSYEPDVDDRLENVATFLFQGLGFTSKKNAWAVPWEEKKTTSRCSKHNDDDRLPSWDNGSVFNCQYDDGYADSDVENLDILVSQPCQVNKIEVQYDKTSKQVDVHVLKKTLRDLTQESIQMSEAVYNNAISLKHILSTFPDDCPAAKLQDISPHLCFICLLHLVNEHGLNMHDCPNLDDLIIQLPLSSQNTGDVILSSS